MDLTSLVQASMDDRNSMLKKALAQKYGVPEEELSEIVSVYLRDAYGPALEVAKSISESECPVVLFIGKEGCAICQRSRPELNRFLERHGEVKLVKLDYSEPPGLLYHAIHSGEGGMLPMIALICGGCVTKLFTGECVLPDVLEKHYAAMVSGCGQKRCATG
jgi:hypothetical protein